MEEATIANIINASALINGVNFCKLQKFRQTFSRNVWTTKLYGNSSMSSYVNAETLMEARHLSLPNNGVSHFYYCGLGFDVHGFVFHKNGSKICLTSLIWSGFNGNNGSLVGPP